MKNAKNIVLGLVLVAGIGSAQAADTGFYVEGNVGTNVASVAGDVGTGGFALNANAGYEFNKYIAAEGGYMLHAADGLSLHAIHAAAKGTLPVNDKVKLFAKLGVATAYLDIFSATGVFYGAGAAYAFNDKVDLNVQYQGMSVNSATLGMVSTGITYHIG